MEPVQQETPDNPTPRKASIANSLISVVAGLVAGLLSAGLIFYLVMGVVTAVLFALSVDAGFIFIAFAGVGMLVISPILGILVGIFVGKRVYKLGFRAIFSREVPPIERKGLSDDVLKPIPHTERKVLVRDISTPVPPPFAKKVVFGIISIISLLAMLAFIINLALPIIPSEEREALAKFGISTSWVSPCHDADVKCGGSLTGYVEELKVSGLKSIPPELGNLSSLRSLRLPNNEFTTIPPELFVLPNLETLDLSYGQLRGPIPPGLSGLSSLRNLNLQYNKFTTIPPELFVLSTLESLNLANNQLRGSIPPELGDLSSLSRLDLAGSQVNNRLSGAIPPELGDISSLSWLDLSGNQLSGAIPPELGNLSNLRRLDLSYNQLSGALPPELGKLSKLQFLSLSGNRLFGSLPLELSALSHLSSLSLYNSNLCEPQDAAFQEWFSGIDDLYQDQPGVVCSGKEGTAEVELDENAAEESEAETPPEESITEVASDEIATEEPETEVPPEEGTAEIETDEKATEEPEAELPPEEGFSRSNPYSPFGVISAPNWDIEIIETLRGNEAWQAILAANQYHSPPPEGMEFLLLKIRAKCTYTDNDEHLIRNLDFDATGDNLVRYRPSSIRPEPELEATLFSNGETDGWVSFLVSIGEDNLILIFDESTVYHKDQIRYIAIEEGSYINIPSELKDIKPTDLGKDRKNPVPFGEKAITDNWEITFLEIIRGKEAWTLVEAANHNNAPPEEGMEYILIKVKVRYIAPIDEASNIDRHDFKATGSANTLYDLLPIVVPDPELRVSLFPGGEDEGWIIVQAAIGETGLVAVLDFLGESNRFLSLEP